MVDAAFLLLHKAQKKKFRLLSNFSSTTVGYWYVVCVILVQHRVLFKEKSEHT